MASTAEQMARNVRFSDFAKAKDLQQRILFTLGILVLYRLGTFIPVPGIDASQFQAFFENQQGGMLGQMSMFGGGALERMAIFALNVMPYITASIIMQMMASASPTLEKLKKEGESGRKQINQYTRYMTLGFALVQSFGISVGMVSNGMVMAGIPAWFFLITSVSTLTGGTMLLMWMGEQITARGIGNGISLIIFAGIIAELPRATFNALFQAGDAGVNFGLIFAAIALLVALTVFIVFVERSQRRLQIQYPKRQQANGVAQGQTSFLPLKINTSGVIPPIFAIAILMLPMTVAGFAGGGIDPATGESTAANPIVAWLAGAFSPGSWTYIITYGVLVAFFTFFYTSIMFNPKDTADNLRRYGGFIPGIRPGSNTAAYIDYVLTRLTTIGAIYLVFVCILPEFIRREYNQLPAFFGGTSLLIIVSVTMDTVTQIQSHTIAQRYEGMMKNKRIGGKRSRISRSRG